MPIVANINLSLGARLLKWRRAKGLTQEGAAREIGVPFRTYQDTERGVSEPEGFGRALLLKMLDQHEASSNTDQPMTPHTTKEGAC